jgi:DNA-binding NtrC family response regulator
MRVLVVDDDEIYCRFLAEVLDEVGMGALCVTDGFAAYDLMKRDPYDICIIDVRMPLILGTELADAIKEDHPHMKIILASAFPDRALQEYAAREGVFLLSKPFTTMQLIDKIQTALGESIGRN